MRYLKKITLIALTFIFAFLIIGNNTNIKASSEWTLESDGYYYYNKDIKYNEEIHYLASNGNPIFIKNNDTEKEMIYSYKISLQGKLYSQGTSSANILYSSVNRYTEEINHEPPTIYKLLHVTYDNTDGAFTENSVAPITIRYRAELYNINAPGDLSLPGYPNYELVQTTEEEYDFVGWTRQYGFQVMHNYSLVNIDDPNFIKHNLKIFYHDNYSTHERQGVMYDLEKVVWRVEKIGQEITYWKMVTNNTDVIKVNSFNELPLTIGNFDNGLNGVGKAFVTEVGSDFQIQINYSGEIYQILIDTVPEFIKTSKKVHYFTEKGQRYLTGFYENHVKWTETSDLHENLMENSYIVWNMTTGEFMASEINFVPARLGDTGHSWHAANKLYADIIIPHKIDDLLAISVSYKYQYHYLNGSKGEWQSVNEQILMKDEYSPGYPSWWWGFALIPYSNVGVSHQVPQIKEISLTNSYKLDYLNWLNDKISEEAYKYDIEEKTYTQNEVFQVGSKAYSLYLGTFNKFWSTGVGAKEFTILQYRYEYKGVEYSNPYPVTMAPDHTPPDRGIKVPSWITKFLSDVWAWILKYSYIAIPIVGVATIGFIYKGIEVVQGKKLRKHRILILIGWIAALFSIWFMLTK